MHVFHSFPIAHWPIMTFSLPLCQLISVISPYIPSFLGIFPPDILENFDLNLSLVFHLHYPIPEE